MIMIVENIDAVARKLARDVLFIDFTEENWDEPAYARARDHITVALDKAGMSYRFCFPFYKNSVHLGGIPSSLYIDLPYEPESKEIQFLDNLLENNDGSPAFDGAVFRLLTLEQALINAVQDDPEFWENY